MIIAAAVACTAAPASQPDQSSSAATGEIVVFAASSLTDAFNEIGGSFQKANPRARVAFNFGASSQLRTQLEQGARADIFASANAVEMDKARQAGVIGGTDRVFAQNRLAVILPKNNPGGIKELRDLATPGLKFVTAATEVPIGTYTMEMLDKMSNDAAFGSDFKDKVNKNTVSREPNVRQVVAKIALGEADAAVVYSSDVTPSAANNLDKLDIPDRYNALAGYPIAMVKGPLNPSGAEAFVSYLLSTGGQSILKKWRFLAP